MFAKRDARSDDIVSTRIGWQALPCVVVANAEAERESSRQNCPLSFPRFAVAIEFPRRLTRRSDSIEAALAVGITMFVRPIEAQAFSIGPNPVTSFRGRDSNNRRSTGATVGRAPAALQQPIDGRRSASAIGPPNRSAADPSAHACASAATRRYARRRERMKES